MLITLWWKAWSGKWTLWKLLAEKLGYEIISIWDMKRKLAAEMGINIIDKSFAFSNINSFISLSP